MKQLVIKKSLLMAVLALIYGAIMIALPDFPLTKEVFVGLLLYIVVKSGVEVVEARFVEFVQKFL